MAVWVGCGDDGGMPMPDGGSCATAADCDDGVYCNGAELCSAGICMAGDAPCTGTCDEDTDMCSDGTCADDDMDGHEDVACGGDDCDDSDPNRFPGNTEVCDAEGVDEDCDMTTFGDTDVDGDGAISDACCNGSTCGDDCDDSTIARRPSQLEICDSVDNDCDGSVDEEMNDVPWYEDEDGDGFGSTDTARTSCIPVPGASLLDTDCEDGVPQANPAGVEACNTVDDDCDGMADEGLMDCDPCIDGDDVCDGIDLDCDGTVDENPDENDFFTDADGDGVGTGTAMPMTACTASGFARRDGDCDDGDASVGDDSFPELCDALDNDCDGTVDEGLTDCTPAVCELPDTGTYSPGSRYEFRIDGAACGSELSSGTVVFSFGQIDADDDRDPYPGAFISGVVSLSDGEATVTNSVSYEFPEDTDITVVLQLADGRYATLTFQYTVTNASAGEGTVTVSAFTTADCSTRMSDEVAGECNGVDEDCDGTVDEGITIDLYNDSDMDGAGGTVNDTVGCGSLIPPNLALVGGDCDDFDDTRSPLFPEVCDGVVDEDCDSMVDEDPEATDSCAAPNATTACTTGSCEITACTGSFEDCDGDPSNGCEIDTQSDWSACGGCDMPCFDVCTAGVCGDTDHVHVAAGEVYNGTVCYVKASGALFCLGDSGNRYFPDETIGFALGNVTDVSLGSQSLCAVANGGEVWCAGEASALPMVTMSAPDIFTFVQVPGISDAVQVQVGTQRTCVRRTGGEVLCADGGGSSFSATGPSDAIDISVEGRGGHLCIVRTAGTVVCQETSGAGFTTIGGLSGASQVAAGNGFGCAVTGGSVMCWGDNGDGQLGDGTMTSSATAVMAENLTSATQVTANPCAVNGGDVFCWSSFLGPSPVELTSITETVTKLANSGDAICVIDDAGGLACY